VCAVGDSVGYEILFKSYYCSVPKLESLGKLLFNLPIF